MKCAYRYKLKLMILTLSLYFKYNLYIKHYLERRIEYISKHNIHLQLIIHYIDDNILQMILISNTSFTRCLKVQLLIQYLKWFLINPASHIYIFSIFKLHLPEI